MGEWNGKIAWLCGEQHGGRGEVRKQHLLTSYFDFRFTEELKKCFVNYEHTSKSITIDCIVILNCRFRFVATYIDVLVVMLYFTCLHSFTDLTALNIIYISLFFFNVQDFFLLCSLNR